MTVYATISYGGLLYTGGSEKIIVYYDFTVSVGWDGRVSCLERILYLVLVSLGCCNFCFPRSS